MSIKISQLELENVKRIKACAIVPAANGLTVIGGDNNQGKTSVLDGIAWALGGDRFRPSEPTRDGSVLPPSIHIELSNGLIVERKGKNSDLKVIDPDGNKSGQQLLNEFVETLAINLPKFMQATNKEKADTLLQIIGVGAELYELERQESELYNRRLTIGQIADQKKKYAAEMTYHPDAPKDLISASELIKQQQSILARNGENQRKRECRAHIQQEVIELEKQMRELQERLQIARENLVIAEKDAIDLQDESTEELELNITNIDSINIRVRANLDKEKAETDAQEYTSQYDGLTGEINGVRQKKMDLLNGAKLPLEGLSVEDGELTYKGYKWDGLSGSDQLKVATAIVRAVNPKCGFVLLDKLEQMDLKTLQEFGSWLEAEGLQAIATRVSTGDECSIIISDGYAVTPSQVPENKPSWKPGEF
ncbi:MAG: chromosome segregation protein SMC [Firmicutes bacterium HGW-Firmicutes-16]|nr:MAG: chromosome segregation protein SMC [Firmicutes bacterium HGW-Firmicutes-16]